MFCSSQRQHQPAGHGWCFAFQYPGHTDSLISFPGRSICGEAVWGICHGSSCPDRRVPGGSGCVLVLWYLQRPQPKLLSSCSSALPPFLQTTPPMSPEKSLQKLFTDSLVTKVVRISVNCSLREVHRQLKVTGGIIQNNEGFCKIKSYRNKMVFWDRFLNLLAGH